MSLLLAVDLADQAVLSIGGGRVAERRLLRLLELAPGLRVTIVSPELTPRLQRLVCSRNWHWQPRPAREEDFERPWALVLVNVADAALDSRLCTAAKARGLWVASANGFGNVRLVAVREVGPLRLAVDTGGRSPGLARALADRLAAVLARWLDRERIERYERTGWPRDARTVEQELNAWLT